MPVMIMYFLKDMSGYDNIYRILTYTVLHQIILRKVHFLLCLTMH